MEVRQPPLSEADRHRLHRLLNSWGLPEGIVEELDVGLSRRSYPAGSVIFVEDSPADALFWVSHGAVMLHRILEDGSRSFTRVLGRGDFLGLYDRNGIGGGWTRRFSATATTNSTLLAIPYEHAYRVLRSLPSEVLIVFIERLNAQWFDWVNSCGRFLGLTFRERLDDVLCQLGAKFGIVAKSGIALTFVPNLADLAEMIGSSAALVRKLVADLTSEGELACRGSRYVLLRGGSIASRLLQESTFHRPRHFWRRGLAG